MTTIINLDLNNKIKTTEYGYQFQLNPLPVMYLSFSKEDYKIDYSKFEYVQLAVQHDLSKQMETFRLDSSKIVNSEEGTFLEWQLTDSLLAKKDKLIINSLVRYDGFSYPIREFSIVVFEDYYPETIAITQAIDMYNSLYQIYLDLLKRKELGVPLGIIPLDNKAKIIMDYFEAEFINHIDHRLVDTLGDLEQLHGLRINKKNYQLEYYHETDAEWYEANSIHGGKFGYSNNPVQYDVFGGNFVEIDADTIDGGNFQYESKLFYDARIFRDEVNKAFDAGNFGQTKPVTEIDDSSYKKNTPITGGGFR